jgi:hypothetical protein
MDGRTGVAEEQRFRFAEQKDCIRFANESIEQYPRNSSNLCVAVDEFAFCNSKNSRDEFFINAKSSGPHPRRPQQIALLQSLRIGEIFKCCSVDFRSTKLQNNFQSGIPTGIRGTKTPAPAQTTAARLYTGSKWLALLEKFAMTPRAHARNCLTPTPGWRN